MRYEDNSATCFKARLQQNQLSGKRSYGQNLLRNHNFEQKISYYTTENSSKHPQ